MLPALFCLLLLQDPPSELRVQDLQASIGFLASDELEGRESGERGEKLAVQYIVQDWERLKFKPVMPDGSYTQSFEAAGKTCTNTVALLPGTDPKLADQILVIGAHHDHVGLGKMPGESLGLRGEIHNGADDNASGTAGVMELAEWFAAHPTRRPILFMTFSAEERGLLGSKYFVEHSPIPLKNFRVMLNCDMLGRSRDGYLFVGGLGTADEFHALLGPILDRSSLKLERSDAGMAPSDNSSFHAAGVPALFFFTGIHEDYHLPGDDADKINYAGELAALQLVRQIAQAVQDDDQPLHFHSQPDMGLPQGFMEQMGAHYEWTQRRNSEAERTRGHLGLSFQQAAQSGEPAGMIVGQMGEDSAARAAGIQTGDTLVSVNGVSILSSDDLYRVLNNKHKDESVSVVVRRKGQDNSYTVVLR